MFAWNWKYNVLLWVDIIYLQFYLWGAFRCKFINERREDGKVLWMSEEIILALELTTLIFNCIVTVDSHEVQSMVSDGSLSVKLSLIINHGSKEYQRAALMKCVHKWALHCWIALVVALELEYIGSHCQMVMFAWVRLEYVENRNVNRSVSGRNLTGPILGVVSKW